MATAGLASATGRAAVNAPPSSTASGSAAAPFVPGANISVTLTAVNPVRATGAAKNATVSLSGVTPPYVALNTTSASGSASYTYTFTQAVPAGDGLAVAVSVGGVSPAAATTITDSGGNVWFLTEASTGATSPNLAVFVCDVKTALTTADTFTLTFASALAGNAGVIAIGAPGQPAIDVRAAPSSGTSTAPSVSATVGSAGSTALSFSAWASAGLTGTTSGPFTRLAQANPSGFLTAAYDSGPAPGSLTSASVITSAAWRATMVVFKAPAPVYMSNVAYINAMDAVDHAHTSQFFAGAQNFSIGNNAGTVSALPAGYSTTPVMRYIAYGQFWADVTGVNQTVGSITYIPVAGGIDPRYTWVMYDTENYSPNPPPPYLLAENQAEINDPWTYMASFTTLAHSNGYKVLLLPAVNLASDATSVNPKLTGETFDAWYLRTSVAGTAAGTTAEICGVQAQADQQTLGTFYGLWSSALQQIRSGGPAAQAFVGVSTVYGTATNMANAAKYVANTADGYWVNAITTGEAVLFLQVMAGGTVPAITLSPTSLPSGSVGSSYNQTLTASGGTGPYTFAVTAGSLPAGLSLAGSTGIISGAPTTAAAYNFTITATDSLTNTGTAVYPVTITAGAVTLAVAPPQLSGGLTSTAYSQTITASGGTGPYTFTVSAGSLPAGLSLAGPTGVISGTPTTASAYSFTITARDSLGNTGLRAYTVAISTLDTATPLFPLNVIVEVLINGTWRDISRYVYERDTMTITGGSTTGSDTPQPASVNVTLDNRDGRFSPNNTAGAYYPYLQRNVQLRISVNDTSSSGNVYNGYRFWGEVSEWPPLSDVSGTDIYVQLVASGPLRRIRKGGGEGSALTRYYATLTGLNAPVAYWPAEEDPDTNQVGAGVEGGSPMVVTGGTPIWKAISNFNGSAPIGVVNGSTWIGQTGSFGTSGDDVYLVPGTYLWIASTAAVDTRVTGGGGGGSKGSEGNSGGSGGGGGGFARDSAVAVTPGQVYKVVVGAGGQPGNWNTGGGNGTNSSFAGDTVTVTGNAGQGSNANGASGAPGGTTSGAATANFPGGAGGGSAGFNQGGGGAGSGGTAAAGHNGGNASFGSPGSGGSAVAGGGSGGTGGGFSPQRDGNDGGFPGGAGGGGWSNNSNHTFGGAGAPGGVELIYTGSGGGTQPSNNVIRFVVFVPKHGGNTGAVLLRVLTNGSVARIECKYNSGGSLRMTGWTAAAGGTLLFDSGIDTTVGADGTTLMVSLELAGAGGNVNWAFSAIVPGQSGAIAKHSGTVTSASMGSVTQVIVAPNGDITKTAMGHISVQYARIPLWKVSKALDGHHEETGIDRFIRLGNEQALQNLVEYNEGADHWGFETGIQSWKATNATIAQSSFTLNDGSWPPVGTHSLLVTASGGAGQWFASSPNGLGGQPVLPGDVVSAAATVYAPAPLGAVKIAVNWYDSGGTYISTSNGAVNALEAGQIHTVHIGAKDGCIAPTGAAFFSLQVVDFETVAAGTQMYVDHIHASPLMDPQTRKRFHEFLEEIKDLDQGIMKEAKTAWGLTYRTRIRVINQIPSIILDYPTGVISPPLAPVIDTVNVKNDITVHRHKGSKVQVTLQNGQMSILEPPAGTGRQKKRLKVLATADEQIAALAAHLLAVGTTSTERYPTITVNLARAGIAGNPVAPLMSAIAGVEVGDVIEIISMPFWFPSATASQMVVGYTETLNAYEWTITWNCVPYTPFIQVTSQIRRW